MAHPFKSADFVFFPTPVVSPLSPSVGPKYKQNTVLDMVCHLLANFHVGLNFCVFFLLDDNASFQTFGPQTQDFAPRDLEGSGPKGFFGVLEDEKHKRSKRQFREVNFIAPQNL